MKLHIALITKILSNSISNNVNIGYQENIVGNIELIKPQLTLHKSSWYYQLNVEAYNNTFYMLLEKNNDLINTQDDNGSVSYKGVVFQDYKPIEWALKNNNSLDLLLQEKHPHYYQGIQKVEEIGWARFISNNEFDEIQGVFKFNQVMYHVQPSHTYSLNKHMYDPMISPSYARTTKDKQEANTVIYKSTDMEPNLSRGGKDNCGIHQFDKSVKRRNIYRPGLANYQLMRRDGQQSSACGNTPKRVLYVSVVADCTYVMKYKTETETRKQIIQEFNVVSGLYERTFNIQLGILKLLIPLTQCKQQEEMKFNRECSEEYLLNDRLKDFSYWVDKQNSTDIGIWHLLTNCRNGEQVGLAWVKTICLNQLKAQLSPIKNKDVMELGTGVSSITRETWKVIAHEIGHNFGAIHDCTESLCPCIQPGCTACCPCEGNCNCGSKYIMNAESKPNADLFSPCSIMAICETIHQQLSSKQCLHEPNYRPTVKEAMCGNGIVEEGEECDCGNNCKSDCCNPKTCKLKSNAKCDDSNMDCCDKCQISKSKTICRKSIGECDVEEMCDGTSSLCPKDLYVQDGSKCSKNSIPNSGDFSDLKCAQGQCTSRDSQCYSRGSKLGVTKDCNQATSLSTFGTSSCSLLCAKPNDGYQCMEMQGSFLDGTQCGRNMFCFDGQCKGGNALDKLATLFESNFILSIAVSIILTLFVLSCLSTIFCGCYRRRQLNKK